MELQPILQLTVTGATNIEFAFTNVEQYKAGVVKYGAVQLYVSSTVDWDLFAVATSNNGTRWDVLSGYGGGADALGTNQLPLSLLELHQYPANVATAGFSGQAADYSMPFPPVSAPVPGQNSIYECPAAMAYQAPPASGKYIAGHAGTANYMRGGTYLAQAGGANLYKYTIDYRIVPGLPVTFPMAGTNAITSSAESLDATTAGTYARPGIYTMDVKYVLVENQ